MVVYRLANQAAGIPLDDSREAGRPEGLVEFAPANDTVISDKLEKMVVAPPGITGQCFNTLNFHHVALSLHAGSLATASQSLFLSTQPPVRACGSDDYYWVDIPALQAASAAPGRRLGDARGR
jgi:hypothetical protein